MVKQKSVKIGKVVSLVKEDKNGKEYKTRSIILGDEGATKPQYRFTVDIRVKDANGNVVAKLTNPWVNISTPHPNAPKNILNELLVWVDDNSL